MQLLMVMMALHHIDYLRRLRRSRPLCWLVSFNFMVLTNVINKSHFLANQNYGVRAIAKTLRRNDKWKAQLFPYSHSFSVYDELLSIHNPPFLCTLTLEISDFFIALFLSLSFFLYCHRFWVTLTFQITINV